MVAVITGLAHLGLRPSRTLNILIFGYSMLWCLSFGKRPLRYALGLIALLLASSLYTPNVGQLLLTERNFYGVLRVTNSPNGKLRYLIHGATLHGAQSLNAAQSREPLTYYTRSGPAGRLLHALQAKTLLGSAGEVRKPRWAVVGLGAGAMACYAQPGEQLTYYEINPQVEQIASNQHYFTYLQQCAPTAQIILGDARLKLRDAPDSSYDLIVLDAFSGDTIPMHLMTAEALALYQRKLAPGGMIAFHISNLYLDLAPTLAALAHDAGFVSRMDDDLAVLQAQTDTGKMPSRWLVMARSQADLGELASDPHWTSVKVPPGTQLWTDDYSNLLRIIKWE